MARESEMYEDRYSSSRDRVRSRDRGQQKSSRGAGHEERRKRDRSRSRDTPRKRRSPDARDARDRDHDRDRRRDRTHDSDPPRRDSRRKRSASRSRSPRPRKERSPEPFKRSRGPLPSQDDAFDHERAVVKGEQPVEKQKPNFGQSGRLAAASNTVQSGGQAVVLKYHEPAEARTPASKDKWRMYVFKGDEIVDTVELAQQSCWLFGREAAVVDVLLEHSSCSKQHAVIQFRYLEKRNEFGDKIGKVKPYVLDLESANQTQVNDHAIPEAKYVELKDKDMVKFGHSSREYVIQLPPSG